LSNITAANLTQCGCKYFFSNNSFYTSNFSRMWNKCNVCQYCIQSEYNNVSNTIWLVWIEHNRDKCVYCWYWLCVVRSRVWLDEMLSNNNVIYLWSDVICVMHSHSYFTEINLILWEHGTCKHMIHFILPTQ
jgi:hypothetical protein